MINLTGINKAELLSEAFNYAKDMAAALKITDQSLEATIGFLIIATAEIRAGKTNKTTTVKSSDVKKIMLTIQNSTINNEYLNKDSARTILNADKTIKRLNGIPLRLDFRGEDIESTQYNSMYGHNALECTVNTLKDYVGLKKNGTPKKIRT